VANKTVLMPVRVPSGDYCVKWEVGKGLPTVSCPHWDGWHNDGCCAMGFPITEYDEDDSAIKPVECAQLQEVISE